MTQLLITLGIGIPVLGLLADAFVALCNYASRNRINTGASRGYEGS